MSKKKETLKIYKPRGHFDPQFETNPIVDNYTSDDGRVYNSSVENIIQAKEEVDANEK